MTGMPHIDGVTVVIAVFIAAAIIIIAAGLRALFYDPGERALPRGEAPQTWRRPAPASQPPAQFAPAPPPEFSYGPDPSAWLAPAAPVPEVWHDDYRPAQVYHEPPAAPARSGAAGPSPLLLVIFAAAIARDQEWRAEVLAPYTEWERAYHERGRLPGPDTLTGMRAITDGGAR